MQILSVVHAVRVTENQVLVVYCHTERMQNFRVEWNNIHPSTGETGNYDLQVDCECGCEELKEIVEDAIKEGSDDCELYLEIRGTFNASQCEDLV